MAAFSEFERCRRYFFDGSLFLVGLPCLSIMVVSLKDQTIGHVNTLNYGVGFDSMNVYYENLLNAVPGQLLESALSNLLVLPLLSGWSHYCRADSGVMKSGLCCWIRLLSMGTQRPEEVCSHFLIYTTFRTQNDNSQLG